MATTEESISELLDQLHTRTIEDPRIWNADPLTTYSIYHDGTFQPSYGNVTVGGIAHTSATGINVSSGYSFTGQNIQPNNTVHIRGEDADLLINDKSLKNWMEKVEERLNILTPNPEMEKEWDDLRKLGERYRKLEKKCREKTDMWKKLKSMPRPDLL